MFKKIKRYLNNPYFALGNDMIKKCPRLMSDKFYLSVLWMSVMGYELDWKHPQTFNEKLQWLKLCNRSPLYTTLVDKYRVKQWVSEKIGEQYVIPTLAKYESVDEIELDKLPNQFVLKCNHDSGSVVICRDKESFDSTAAKRKLDACLKHDFYLDTREWPYKNVQRCIMAEQFLAPSPGSDDLPDYKFFCFNGNADCVMVCIDRLSSQTRFYFFDEKWNLMRLNGWGKKAPDGFTLPQPKNLDKMFELAAVLSQGISFVRVDFYNVDGDIRFGEMTLFPDGGLDYRILPEADEYFGQKIELPLKEHKLL